MVIYVTDAIRTIMDYVVEGRVMILVFTIEDVIVDISLKASAVVGCRYDSILKKSSDRESFNWR